MPAAHLLGAHVTSKDTHSTPRNALAARYRMLADESRALASNTAFEDLRNAYLRYEAHWRKLADEADKQSCPSPLWRWLRRLVGKLH